MLSLQEIQAYVEKATGGATASDPFEARPFGLYWKSFSPFAHFAPKSDSLLPLSVMVASGERFVCMNACAVQHLPKLEEFQASKSIPE